MRRKEFKKAVDTWSPSDWCRVVTELGQDACVDFTGTRMERESNVHPRSNTNRCKELIDDLKDNSRYTPKKTQHRWVKLTHKLAQLDFPSKIADYKKHHLMYIAFMLGETFFSHQFVPYLREEHDWKLGLYSETEIKWDTGAAFTGCVTEGRELRPVFDVDESSSSSSAILTSKPLRRLETRIIYGVFDTFFDGKNIIHNDNFHVTSRLDWVTHVIAHELIHCLMICLCKNENKEDDGHGQTFLDLNRLILGGEGCKWRMY